MTIIKAMVQWRTNASTHLVEVRDGDDIVPVKNTCECGATIPYGEVWPSEGFGPTCNKCKKIAEKLGIEVE